jgi:Tfp pilus assembly protein PilN
VIKVNLLATVPGTPAPRIWLPPEQRSAVIGLAILMTTALACGGWWYWLQRDQSALNKKIAVAQTELARRKEAAKIVDQTAARKAELTDRLALIERLRAAKRAPVDLLETISRSLPDGLWLLEVKTAETAVQIDGRALSLTAVTDFAEALQNSGLFAHPVEILATSTEAVEETTVVRFVVKAEPAQPSDPTPEPPPATRGRTAAAGGPAMRPGA